MEDVQIMPQKISETDTCRENNVLIMLKNFIMLYPAILNIGLIMLKWMYQNFGKQLILSETQDAGG